MTRPTDSADRRTRAIFSVCVLLLTVITTPAVAQTQGKTCTQTDVSAAMAAMSAKLKKNNQDNQTRLKARLRDLAKARGWSEAETEEKGFDLLEDDTTRTQDETASHLLGQIDQLSQGGDAPPACAKVEELKTLSAQLVEVTSAKSAHISAKLDTELKGARPAPPPPPAITKVEPPKSVEPRKTAPPVVADAVRPPPARPSGEMEPSSAIKPNDAYVAPGPGGSFQGRPASIDPASQRFSVEDIRAAGSGFFGTISAELAAVLEYTFKSYGQPTGYILGTEGGVALLAGLRYGDGQFVTKMDGERRVYWQGPSVGYDFGLTGSRTMILIYGITNPDEIYQRFGGIDGSAYLVGGAGVTVLKKGPIIMAPIRTGIGLRLGANVGYLHFTPRPRFNPF